MSNKIIKGISAVLATLLIFANSMTLISYAADSFMSENELENQEKTTNVSNVSFDVVYENGKHTATIDADKEATLSLKVSVKNGGYLKNTVVDFSDSNFIVNGENISDNKVELAQINTESEAKQNLTITINKNNLESNIANKDNEIKLTATYVDGNGKEKAVTGKVVIHTNWKMDSLDVQMSHELTKYLVYENKLIVQSKITENIVNNTLPVKNAQLTVNVPTINNSKPQYVSVIANTQATNANTADVNYNYNQDAGIVEIKAANDNSEKITWTNNSTDEFLVTYVYEFSDMEKGSNDIKYSASLNLETYSSNNLKLQKSVEGSQTVNEEFGSIADLDSTITQTVNKGYLYNNIKTADENKKETEFTVNYKAIIPVKSVVENVVINEETTLNNKENSYYENISYDRNVKISKAEFLHLLGEEGTININSESETLTTITKDSPDVDGYFVIDLSNINYNKLQIVTSKPQSEGILNVQIVKALRKDLNYSNETILNLANIQNKSSLTIKNNGQEVLAKENTNTSNLEEPSLKTSIETNRENLSTVIPNEDVEFRVTLENDSIDDKMFENPKVKINLPANIKDISADAELYYDDELSIENTNIINNSDGTKTIEIAVKGEQTKYNNVVAQGATIVVKSNITLEELTPTVENSVNVTVETNGENAQNSCALKYVAPTGVVATNAVTFQNNGEVKVTSLSSDEKTGLIPVATNEQEVTFNMNVINNYGNTISDVVVLGRIPAQGNGTNANLDLTMSSPITVEGIENAKVYYSNNAQASKDTANTWTQEWTSSAKSYMIVIENKSLNVGEGFKFNYKAVVPGSLDYEKYTYENYSVYYTNNQKDGNIAETLQAATTGLTTGSGPKFTADLTANSQEVKSGSLLKYTLNVKNEGSEKAEDVKLTVPMLTIMSYVEEDPEGRTDYIYPSNVEYKVDENDATKIYAVIPLGSIEANSTLTKQIWFKTKAQDDQDTTISLNATVANEKATVTTNTASVKLTKTYFTSNMFTTQNLELRNNEEATITIKAKSSKEYLTDKESSYNEERGEVTSTDVAYTGNRENTILTLNVPNELEIVRIEKGTDDITSTLNKKSNSVNIGTLNYEETTIKVTVKQKELTGNDLSKKVSVSASLKADNTDSEDVGSVEIGVNKAALTISQTSNIPSSVQIGTAENFKYTFTVKNSSKIILSDISFTDSIPNGLVYSFTKVILADGTEETFAEKDENGNAVAKISMLGADETAKVEVNVAVDMTDKDLTVSNTAKISNSEIGEVTSNVVTNKIKAYKQGEIINGGENAPIENKTARIAGTIWIDTNKNGAKDVDEQKVSNVKVLLLNNTTGNIAKDANSNDAITTTDENGTYAFSNIYVGNYTVIFFYDSKTYSPTDYRKEGVSSDTNSDAMDKNVVYEGTEQTAAVTETITLTEDNAYDVDLGLVENKKFDMKLDKTVTNITVTNEAGTNTHEYNKNFAKIDFKDKYANSSTMVVEYKLVVTNDGAVPGYVKKIADYLPEELSFSSELNTNWYASTDGKTVYNNSLANKLLNPGESAEVTLVLTKKMSSNAIGITITNNAEIYETSNDYGLDDVDSTPGNKVQTEDDYSSANVLTSVQTGQVVIYTALGIAIACVLGGGIYIIKKRVIR